MRSFFRLMLKKNAFEAAGLGLAAVVCDDYFGESLEGCFIAISPSVRDKVWLWFREIDFKNACDTATVVITSKCWYTSVLIIISQSLALI